MIPLNDTLDIVTFVSKEECIKACNETLFGLMNDVYYLKIIILILFLLICLVYSINLIELFIKRKRAIK